MVEWGDFDLVGGGGFASGSGSLVGTLQVVERALVMEMEEG